MGKTSGTKIAVIAGLTGRRLWVLGLACLTLAFVGAYSLGLYPASAKNWLAQATTHQPERLTELSFNGPSTLPKLVDAGQPATFGYNITNHTGAPKVYDAVVTLVENGQPRRLTRTTVTLADGQSRNLTNQFSTPKANTPLEILVQLDGEDLEIHFRSQS